MIFRRRDKEIENLMRQFDRERQQWISLTERLNDRLMAMCDKPWTLPPAQVPLTTNSSRDDDFSFTIDGPNPFIP